MKVEEITCSLRQMACEVETGKTMCFGCGWERSCGVHGCWVIKQAAEKLEQLNNFEQTSTSRLLKKNNELQLENEMLKGALYNSAVHGHWSEEGCFYYCSVCGNVEGIETPYCSHCGAWMEVQDDDQYAEDHGDRDEA